MSEQSTPSLRTYEIRLIRSSGNNLLFVAAFATVEEVVEYAKGQMLRHECDNGEVWCGMQLIRQL